jgi:predicted RecB family nuclease
MARCYDRQTMQFLDGRIIYSATDLNNYLECGHLVALERLTALGEMHRSERHPTLDLLAGKGEQHEQRYLEILRTQHGNVREIEDPGHSIEGIERAAAATIAAIAEGVPVIYQGTFFDGRFLGKSDFLLRVEKPIPGVRDWSYEVADTKLALHDKPYFIIQLCHYSEHLGRVQGMTPEHMYVVLGNSERKQFRFTDFAAYYAHLKDTFLRNGALADAYPLKCEHCGICDWASHCEEQRERDDHLSLVAWMRRDDIKRFESESIVTVAQLATAGERPRAMQDGTFDRLHSQAALQVRGRETGGCHYELRPHHPVEGFGLMPKPVVGDVFFDMEGDPYYEIGVGLEYLFGCYCPDDDPPFHAFWGTDRATEKEAFERCVDFLMDRRRRFPEMHVYHYAPYEKTAFRRLAQRLDTREKEIDELLRGEVLVDLYAVVRQSLMVSQSGYSIKDLEPFYGMTRSAEVRKGDDSVLQFERWLKDPENNKPLEDIERYNEEDCRSTSLLRGWLLKLRDEYITQQGIALDFKPVKHPDEPCHPEPVDACKSCAKRLSQEREEAKITDAQHALLQRKDDEIAALLAHLLSYHRREEKPVWWQFFDRCENIDQLLEFDKEAMAGLELRRDIEPFVRKGERNKIYTFSFPDQTHHLKDKPADPHTRESAGEIVNIDEDSNLLQLKRGGTIDDAEKIKALIPGGPIGSDEQKKSLGRVAASYLDGSLPSLHPVTIDILRRAHPRLTNVPARARLQPVEVTSRASMNSFERWTEAIFLCRAHRERARPTLVLE